MPIEYTEEIMPNISSNITDSEYMGSRRIGLSCKDSSRLCSNSNVLLLFERARTFIKVRGSREVLFLLITFFSFSTAAQRPGATFLLIPPSARATGMAYAYTAICDDASANYYNAAGLAFLTAPKITANYFAYLTGLSPDMYYVYCGLAYPLSKSSWGFDAIYFTPGEIAKIDEEGARKGLTFGGGINIENFELDIGIDESIYEFPTVKRKISLSYTF